MLIEKIKYGYAGTVKVTSELGLHSRPSQRFVEEVSPYGGRVTVSSRRGEYSMTVDGKNIMQVIMLAARQGTLLYLKFEKIRGTPEEEEQARVMCDNLQKILDNSYE